MRNIVSYFILTSFFIVSVISPRTAYGEEMITTLDEGEAAPFAGTLFNTEAAARILSDLKFTEEMCNLEIEREVSLNNAEMELQVDTVSARLENCEARYADILVIKNNHINFLSDELAMSHRPRAEIWLAAGVVAGIAVTMGSAWAMGQINN